MINLGFLLHIYQPPNQFPEVLDRIVNECYRPLLNPIVEREAHFTLNMNWSLTEKLLVPQYEDVLALVRKGLEKKSLELTGSAAYHAILPLIPEAERKRQIELNLEKHKALWGDLYQPIGFFPPEMAYGPEILSAVQEAGYRWLITDDVPFACMHGFAPFDFIPKVNGMAVFLRSNFWSNRISLEKDKDGKKYRGDQIALMLLEDLTRWFNGSDGYLILAMDGETFGHHHKGYIEDFILPFLETLQQTKGKMRLLHLSEIYQLFPKVSKEIPPGSWSTSPEDFWSGNFFPLWKSPKNQAHHLLWQLTDMALVSFEKLRDKMDRSLNSCTFWWAATNPNALSPITLTGVDMLLDVIRIADPANLEKAVEIKKKLDEALNPKPVKIEK
jgi:alpha-amylase/alpha-mannosidase (GH57 family)